jgi:hypothetical protein
MSVQESFHAAETFRHLCSEASNFTLYMTKQEFRLFRKRVIGMILATDMAKHASDLAQLKTLISNNNIVNGKNVESLINVEDEN